VKLLSLSLCYFELPCYLVEEFNCPAEASFAGGCCLCPSYLCLCLDRLCLVIWPFVLMFVAYFGLLVCKVLLYSCWLVCV
jgi:hypothetical protein